MKDPTDCFTLELPEMGVVHSAQPDAENKAKQASHYHAKANAVVPIKNQNQKLKQDA